MAILIITPYGFGGKGDFSFAKKVFICLSHVPLEKKFVFVSQAEGIETFKGMLSEDERQCIELLSVYDYNILVKCGKLKIDLLIEGPVFNIDFHLEKNEHAPSIIGPQLKKTETPTVIIPKSTPILLLPEYGRVEKTEQEMQALLYQLRSQGFQKIKVLRTGLDILRDESGIFITEPLRQDMALGITSFMLSDDDSLFKEALLGKQSIGCLLEKNDISMQYSSRLNSANKFLQAHGVWAKSRHKHQIIIAVGSNSKKQVLLENLEALKSNHSKVTYINIKTGTTETLYDNSDVGKQNYTLIDVEHLSHSSLLSLLKVSSPIIGVTGDQSLSEALSASKVIVYECLEHKAPIAKALKFYFKSLGYEYAFLEEGIFWPTRGVLTPISEKMSDFLSNPKEITRYQKIVSETLVKISLNHSLIDEVHKMLMKVKSAVSKGSHTEESASAGEALTGIEEKVKKTSPFSVSAKHPTRTSFGLSSQNSFKLHTTPSLTLFSVSEEEEDSAAASAAGPSVNTNDVFKR